MLTSEKYTQRFWLKTKFQVLEVLSFMQVFINYLTVIKLQLFQPAVNEAEGNNLQLSNLQRGLTSHSWHDKQIHCVIFNVNVIAQTIELCKNTTVLSTFHSRKWMVQHHIHCPRRLNEIYHEHIKPSTVFVMNCFHIAHAHTPHTWSLSYTQSVTIKIWKPLYLQILKVNISLM